MLSSAAWRAVRIVASSKPSAWNPAMSSASGAAPAAADGAASAGASLTARARRSPADTSFTRFPSESVPRKDSTARSKAAALSPSSRAVRVSGSISDCTRSNSSVASRVPRFASTAPVTNAAITTTKPSTSQTAIDRPQPRVSTASGALRPGAVSSPPAALPGVTAARSCPSGTGRTRARRRGPR